MTHKIVSLRVYKDEYQKSFILWLAKTFQCEQTEKILTLTGITEDVAQSIMSLMFKSELEIQKVFPQFRTLYDVEAEARNKILRAFEEMRNALIEVTMSDAFKSLSKEEYAEHFNMMGLPLIQGIATDDYNKFKTHKIG